jgi:hypothetical protein
MTLQNQLAEINYYTFQAYFDTKDNWQTNNMSKMETPTKILNQRLQNHRESLNCLKALEEIKSVAPNTVMLRITNTLIATPIMYPGYSRTIIDAPKILYFKPIRFISTTIDNYLTWKPDRLV